MLIHKQTIDFEIGEGVYTIEVVNYCDAPHVIFKLQMEGRNGNMLVAKKICSAHILTRQSNEFTYYIDILEEEMGKLLVERAKS